MVDVGSPAALALMAGWLGCRADRALGTGTQWTMYAYFAIEKGVVDAHWIAIFEQRINAVLNASGKRPISITGLFERPSLIHSEVIV